MADVKNGALTAGQYEIKWIDQGDGTYALAVAATSGSSFNSVITSMPAADLDSDGVSNAHVSNVISKYLGNNLGFTLLTPKFAPITASSSGATTIVAAVTAKQILVVGFTLTASAAVNAKWQSHTTTATATGLYYFLGAASAPLPAGFMPVGHFATVAGEALDINLSGAVAVGGSLTYVEF